MCAAMAPPTWLCILQFPFLFLAGRAQQVWGERAAKAQASSQHEDESPVTNTPDSMRRKLAEFHHLRRECSAPHPAWLLAAPAVQVLETLAHAGYKPEMHLGLLAVTAVQILGKP